LQFRIAARGYFVSILGFLFQLLTGTLISFGRAAQGHPQWAWTPLILFVPNLPEPQMKDVVWQITEENPPVTQVLMMKYHSPVTW
jgi:hypothetical protein